jgi:hypothetical protein
MPIYVNGDRDPAVFYGKTRVRLVSVTRATVTFRIGVRRGAKVTLGLQALRYGSSQGPTLDRCRIETLTDAQAAVPKRVALAETVGAKRTG